MAILKMENFISVGAHTKQGELNGKATTLGPCEALYPTELREELRDIIANDPEMTAHLQQFSGTDLPVEFSNFWLANLQALIRIQVNGNQINKLSNSNAIERMMIPVNILRQENKAFTDQNRSLRAIVRRSNGRKNSAVTTRKIDPALMDEFLAFVDAKNSARESVVAAHADKVEAATTNGHEKIETEEQLREIIEAV